MPSPVDIANIALRTLGRATIADLAESSAEARELSFWYPIAREQVFADNHWTFARMIAPLAAVTNDLPERWGFAYDRPSTAVTFIGVVDPSAGRPSPDTPRLPHELLGDRVYANLQDAHGEWVRQIEDVNRWPVKFRLAVGYALAALAAYPLTKKETARNDALALYKGMLAEAAEQDAGQQPTTYGEYAAYAEARGAAGDRRPVAGDGDYWSAS